jgi:hypothetical protein
MREIDKISEELFNKICSRFPKVSLGDGNAKRVTNPEDARFFDFHYISNEGKDFGSVSISLIDDTSLKIYFNSNIADSLDDQEQEEWYSFLKSLKKFARRNMLTFDARDITRTNLKLKDIQQQTDSDSTFDRDDIAISESKLYGTSRSSYADVGPHRLIIRHEDHIDPERHGSRGRKIKHIFVETPLGVRFLLNHTNLHGARAIANHLTHGGKIGDEGSTLINEMVKEMASMRHFVRSMRNRTFEDAETTGMVEAAMHRYAEVRDHLKRFKGRRGHEILMGMMGIQQEPDEDVDVDSLRERFVKKIYDDRFNDALPYVYRAYKNRKHMDTDGSKEFESWANDITEATWDDDADDSDEQDLLTLMQNPIEAGVDGVDAIGVVSGISFLDSDDLKSALKKYSHGQPDIDTRRVIIGWLASNGETALANEILKSIQNQNANTQAQPQSPPVPSQNTGASTTDEPVTNESISEMRRLAGLKK